MARMGDWERQGVLGFVWQERGEEMENYGGRGRVNSDRGLWRRVE